MNSRDISFVHTTPVPGVTAILSAGRHNFDRHWHDAFCFGILDDGGQSWWSRRGIVDAYAGAVINSVPGEVHDGRPLGYNARRWRMLSVDPGTMHDLTDCRHSDITIGRPVIEDKLLASALRDVFSRIHSWSARPRSQTYRLAIEERVTEACTLLVTRHGSVPPEQTASRTILENVRDRIADDVANTPSLSELARIAGLSRYQLLRHFRARYGMPPHAWLLSCRAERARQMIRGGATLVSAALNTGFSDQSHMTRTFVRFYGYTPGEWRRAAYGEAPAP